MEWQDCMSEREKWVFQELLSIFPNKSIQQVTACVLGQRNIKDQQQMLAVCVEQLLLLQDESIVNDTLSINEGQMSLPTMHVASHPGTVGDMHTLQITGDSYLDLTDEIPAFMKGQGTFSEPIEIENMTGSLDDGFQFDAALNLSPAGRHEGSELGMVHPADLHQLSSQGVQGGVPNMPMATGPAQVSCTTTASSQNCSKGMVDLQNDDIWDELPDLDPAPQGPLDANYNFVENSLLYSPVKAAHASQAALGPGVDMYKGSDSMAAKSSARPAPSSHTADSGTSNTGAGDKASLKFTLAGKRPHKGLSTEMEPVEVKRAKWLPEAQTVRMREELVGMQAELKKMRETLSQVKSAHQISETNNWTAAITAAVDSQGRINVLTTTNNKQAVAHQSVAAATSTKPAATKQHVPDNKTTASKQPASMVNNRTTAAKQPVLTTGNKPTATNQPGPGAANAAAVGNQAGVVNNPAAAHKAAQPAEAAAQPDAQGAALPAPPPPVGYTLDQQVAQVCAFFPDAEPTYVNMMLERVQVCEDPINIICNHLLETKDYPKVKAVEKHPTPAVVHRSPVKAPQQNYLKDFKSRDVSDEYWTQCLCLLKGIFKRLPVADLRLITQSHFNRCFAPARQYFIEQLQACGVNIHEKSEPVEGDNLGVMTSSILFSPVARGSFFRFTLPDGSTRKIVPLKCARQKCPLNGKINPELKAEIDFLLVHSKADKEEKDHLLATSLNEAEYTETGQLLECGCCFGEVVFESMVQCYEGHLFCKDCLSHYAKEAVFGQGKAALTCMSDGCDATYPKSQLAASLPANILEKYEERTREEDLNLAGLDDLVRCPHCEFAAIMDKGDKVFRCQNPECLKETCRFCKEDWAEHFGIPCRELEKKDETRLRIKFEEKMTEAKIRICYQCKTPFTKLDGCNKMTCRCGATMCYICRKPKINYDHFCRHPLDPGQKCDKCTSCMLWSNPEHDEKLAIEEIRKAAESARQEHGFEEKKLIGAPEENQAKKKMAKKH